MQSFFSFIRPRISTVVLTFIMLGIAVTLFIQIIGCALSGGPCDMSAVSMWTGNVVLWPLWVLVSLFEDRASASEEAVFGIGLALSLVWMYLIACIVRWGIASVWKKNNPQPPVSERTQAGPQDRR